MNKTAQKLKNIIKKPAEPTSYGKNPMDPWSARADINEGSLEQYLKAKGINPEFVSKDMKISHAKSGAFLKWKREHQFEEIIPETLTTEPGLTHKKKAETQKSVHAHKEIKTPRGPGSHNEAKGSQTTQLTPESVGAEIHGEAKKPKMTALDKFRKASAEREKKHKEIEKNSGGMSSAIDRLQKHMNKEENALEEAKHYPYRFRATYHDPDTDKMTHVMDFNHRSLEAAKKHAEGSRLQRRDGKEDKLHSVVQMKEEQIDEISKSTLASYKDKSTSSLKNAQANRDAAEHGKNMSKSFADLHKKSDAIAKKRVKGLKGYLQRKTGMKPTSEDVGDPKAAVNADGLPNPQLEPVSEKKKQMSKSARMIKALYKKKGVVKEDIYDHEKEDKSVATYGKKPKMEKADKDESIGEKKPQAALTLTGGKTLTGTERDTVEIDPMMRNRPGQPDVTKKDDKKDDKKKDEKKDK
jgi:hypothetical protein